MDQVLEVLAAPGQGTYYFEDIQTLQKNFIPERDRFATPSPTPGFSRVREIAETLSIGLRLSDRQVVWGDAVSVSYGGKSGREFPFRSTLGKKEVEAILAPALRGKRVDSFREIAPLVDSLPVHQAIRYGATQALLSAAAYLRKIPEARVITDEWQLPWVPEPLRLQGSCGNDRYDNVDKMIVNRLEALPHTQVEFIPEQLGLQGEVLLQYVEWLKERIVRLGGADYHPVLRLDVHGAIGKIFDHQIPRVTEYLATLARQAAPFELGVESVAIAASFEAQVAWHRELRSALRAGNVPVRLLMDEWANTLPDIRAIAAAQAADGVHIKMPDVGGLHHVIESVLLAKREGLKVLLGGSCVETDLSSRLSVQVAMATRPDLFLVKPGMGINEGISICRNEMYRILQSA